MNNNIGKQREKFNKNVAEFKAAPLVTKTKSLPVVISDVTLTFAARVREVVKQIPKGKTLSYGEVAMIAGSPGAARAVGNVMKNNWDPDVPCHRVVRANGTPGQYNRGSENKIKLLREEGAIR